MSPTGEIGRHKARIGAANRAHGARIEPNGRDRATQERVLPEAKARHKARIGAANRAHGARIEPNGRDRATQEQTKVVTHWHHV